MSRCNSCNRYTCTCSRRSSTSCCNECGCDHEHNGECIFYKGATVDCIPVVKGQDFDTVIENIATYICEEIDPPSAHVYIVEGCDSIDVTTETVENTTTYTVCLDEGVRNQIDDNSANIATALACNALQVRDLISTDSSVNISVDSSGSCGVILDLSVSPSGTPTYEGIVHNDTTAATLPDGGGGDQIVKSFDRDYLALNDLQDSDEIHITVRGKVKGNGTFADSIKISLYDVNSAIEVFTISPPYYSFDTGNGNISSYSIKLEVTAVDVSAGTALVTASMESNIVDNGINSGSRYNQLQACTDATGIDYSNLRIRVSQVNDSNFTGSNDNYCRQLKVEVRKYIGS